MRRKRLTDAQVLALRLEYAAGTTVPDMAKRHDLDTQVLHMLLRGHTYRDAGGPVRPARRRSPSKMSDSQFIQLGQQLILSNVTVAENGCWHWTGTNSSVRGYFNVKFGHRGYGVHKLSHLVFNGEVARGWDVGHLCHDRSDCEAGDACLHRRCCRPDHLQGMPHEDNVRAGRGDWRRRQTHCKRGHPFDEVNTVWTPRPGGRMGRTCRTCRREWDARRRAVRSPRVVPAASIREWARTVGLTVSATGPIPREVSAAFDRAQEGR
jgi:hypothetical protein